MYLEVLVPLNFCQNWTMNGDNFGVCFVKIGHVVLELRMRKVSLNENAIQNIWGQRFSKKCIAFVAPRIFPRERMVHDGRSTVPKQIGGADFESGECDLLECTHMWVCGPRQIYNHQNEY